MKTVHGPDAHVTKKQRNDVHLRAPLLKENGDNEASIEPSGQGSEDSTEASSTSQAVEDCLHVRAIKTEGSGVSRAVKLSWPSALCPELCSNSGLSARVPHPAASRYPSRFQLSLSAFTSLGLTWHLSCPGSCVGLSGVGVVLVSTSLSSTLVPLPGCKPLSYSVSSPSDLCSFCSNHLFFVSTSFFPTLPPLRIDGTEVSSGTR